MKIEFGEWKSCVKEPPKKNGEYIVVCIFLGKSVTTLSKIEFTVEHGWNTSVNSGEYAIDYGADDDFVYYWTDIPTFNAHI